MIEGLMKSFNAIRENLMRVSVLGLCYILKLHGKWLLASAKDLARQR